MAEKVIHEYRLIETDEGYRIEITGDKEQINKWMKGGRRRGPMGWRGGGFGPYRMGFPGMMFMKGHHGPGDFTIEIEEEDEEGESSED
jgi:hypothetical protein